MKGIKRESSVARTSQQNGVAERINRTLIEEARTMLADSLLPTTVWVEEVNTACYVQNRVLVTNPHNKTRYELLISRSPNIEFMRPFGCHVTILNTLDRLGKFDGKADEGFLVGYSVNSKAFRVFNSRTRKVEVNLHVNFLENKPNVAGSRPEWLFDIDSLTKSMIYEPVSAGNQSNGDTCSKHIFMQGKPLRRKQHTHAVNAASTSINTASKIIATGSLNINTTDSNQTNMSTLEATSIFDGSFDDKDLGAEADTNNLDSSTVVSPIATTIVHKDHPKEQIIRDPNLNTQTRRMINFFEETVMVYVCQPHGFKDPNFPDKVYKVKKAHYGLHQAPRAWYETLSTYLLNNRFKRGQIDKTLFIKRNKRDILLVQVYVDDIIFGSTKKKMCDAFEILTHEKFQMSLMGELTFFLGLAASWKLMLPSIKLQLLVTVNAAQDMGITPVKTHQTPIVDQPSTSKPQKKQQPGGNRGRSLQEQVLDLQEAKAAQAKEIAALKKNISKLNKWRKSRSRGLKRLKKFGSGRTNDDEMFRVDDLAGEEVVMETTTGVKDSDAPTTDVTEDEIKMAQALAALKSVKPKVVVQEQEMSTTIPAAATIVTIVVPIPRAKGIVFHEQKKLQIHTVSSSKDKGKAKMIEPGVPIKRKDQIRTDEETSLESDIPKKQKVDENVNPAIDDSKELRKCIEIVPDDGDEVLIEATPISSRSPTIIDYKIHKEGKKTYFKIIRADGNSQVYQTFVKMFKNFNRDDLEVLGDIVKDRFKKEKSVDDMDNILFRTLKTMFKHPVEDTIWKYQQGLAKVYPLTRNTLHQLWSDVRLQVDYDVEMAYDLLRFIKKQLMEELRKDGAKILRTALGSNQLKESLEDLVGRRRQNYNATPSRLFSEYYKDGVFE
nr:ribonuclease H-like domain-containing protein [Tanacetum cinerariifolium]